MANSIPRLTRRDWSKPAALRAVLALFFLWGFLTCLNDILMPQLQAVFALSYTRAILVPVTFFATCFVFAPVSGTIIEYLGYQRAMVAGLLTMGAGALLFLPAAWTVRFASFLVAIGVIGAGITVLQAAAAPYVAFLGLPETAASRFSLALGFNSLGTVVAPLFGGWLILRSSVEISPGARLPESGNAARLQAMSVFHGPYLFLACMLILLAVAVAFSGLPRMRTVPETSVPLKSVFRHKPLIFGAVTIFLYAGAEVGIGSFLVNYLSLPAILGVSRHNAALLAAFYWGGAVAGRFFGWYLLQRLRGETVLATIAATAGVLVTISVVSHGILAAAALLAVGLCNAMIVPIVVMLGISGLGPLTARASSVMVAANIGAGLGPLALGMLADRIGVHHALGLTILSYAGAICYALWGSRGHLLQREAIAAGGIELNAFYS
ncbi:MAG TPA: glucose/galactose MFS transporter [Acidobacteriaceae bacterium]